METRYVFISHSSKDYDELQPLAEFIRTTGMQCWFSEENLDKTKASWPDELMDALKQADSVLLYLSQNAIDSGEVYNEIANASAMGINLIPYIPADVVIPSKILYMIRKYEWISAYQLEEKTIKEILRGRMLENISEIREVFDQTTQSTEYLEFVRRVMRKYYGNAFFTTVNGVDFQVFSLPGRVLRKITSIRDFDVLGENTDSVLSGFDIRDHQKYIRNKWYTEYSELLNRRIRFPNRPGYMLDELLLNDQQEVSGIRVHVGTYAENVYSTHVLEYELYKLFEQYGSCDIDDPRVWHNMVRSMPLRNQMHPDMPPQVSEDFYPQMFHSLLCGTGRETLLSVQMLVVMKSSNTKKYEVKIAQRSNTVAILPGVWQFIPAGGFELLNDSNDDIYDDLELEENFSPGCAIFREYLEELFNIPEFEGRGTGSIEERLMKDEHIVTIEKMLRHGEASLQFLGSAMELSGLRHELSFVLVIHDETYSEQRFIANEECRKGIVHSIPLEAFEKKSSVWKRIHGPSAAMWNLFRQTELYQSCIRFNAGQA